MTLACFAPQPIDLFRIFREHRELHAALDIGSAELGVIEHDRTSPEHSTAFALARVLADRSRGGNSTAGEGVAEPTQEDAFPGRVARLAHQAEEPVGTLTPPTWSRWFGRGLSAGVFILVVVLALRASPWG